MIELLFWRFLYSRDQNIYHFQFIKNLGSLTLSTLQASDNGAGGCRKGGVGRNLCCASVWVLRAQRKIANLNFDSKFIIVFVIWLFKVAFF